MELSAQDLQQLQDLEHLLARADNTTIHNLSKLLTEDFIEIGSSGNIYNKQQTISAQQKPNSVEITLSHFSASWVGNDLALVNYQSHKQQGNSTKMALRSSLWQRVNGDWQLRFHQATPLQTDRQ